MALTLPQVLCNLGTKLAGAEETVAVDEAISTLDKVRLAAFTNDVASIDCKPSLLGSDSLIPGDLFLYNQGCESRIRVGPRHVHVVSGLRIVGGAILQSRSTHFPVSVLYSDRSEAVMLHAGSVPFAQLEAEFYDGAFEDHPVWESKMLGDEAQEFMAWRREAASGARCAGLTGTPSYLYDGKGYHVVRNGVTAFMSLRAPGNECEADELAARLASDMQAVPCGDLSFMETHKEKSGVLMGFIGESTAEIVHNKELPEVEFDERLRNARSMIKERAILTWLSTIILHSAVDDAIDEQGEHKSEYCTGLKYRPSNDAAIQSAYADELRSVGASSAIKCSDLERDEIRKRGGYTLPSVMSGMGRDWTTKSIISTSGANARAVMEATAIETFDASDAHAVSESCSQHCTDHMTPHTAIGVLGKCLVEDQALVVVTREQDGRISNAKLIGKDVIATNVGSDVLSRLMLFPWVTCVIIDKENVSVLLIKEPDGVDQQSFARTKLRLRETAKPKSGASDVGLAKVVADLKSEVSDLKTANTAALGAIRDFERKLNLLLEKRYENEPEEVPPARPRSETVPPAASMASAAEPTPSSEVVESLKRTLDILTRFEKKPRSA